MFDGSESLLSPAGHKRLSEADADRNSQINKRHRVDYHDPLTAPQSIAITPPIYTLPGLESFSGGIQGTAPVFHPNSNNSLLFPHPNTVSQTLPGFKIAEDVPVESAPLFDMAAVSAQTTWDNNGMWSPYQYQHPGMTTPFEQWIFDADYTAVESGIQSPSTAFITPPSFNGQAEMLVLPPLQPSNLLEMHFTTETAACFHSSSASDIAMQETVPPVPGSDSIEPTISASVSTPLASPRSYDTPRFNGIRQVSELGSANDTATPGSPGNSEGEDECDVCLGVINTVSNSSFSGTQAAPIIASVYGKMLKLAFQGSGKYAGILNSPVLSCLLQDFKVRFSAQLLPPDQARGPERKPGKQELKSPKLCPVRIVIYAMRGDERAIGAKLSDAGLFLQHPAAHECSSQNVSYSNPHYLARPGSEPPTLEDLSLTANDSSPLQDNRLDNVGMSRLLRIFDLAEPDGSGASISVDPSPRLSSTLMSHQLVALAMMIERECGIVENPRFPTLWASTTDNRSRQIITGKYRDSPVPVYGGVLADEMGLGKTLSVLALICSSLDDFHHHQSASQQESIVTGTLIIAPKSTITAWQEQIDRHIFQNQIKVGLYHGTKRRQLASQLQHLDVVITTYETLRFDWEAKGPLFTQPWLRVVLDEAHHIRNRSSLAFKSTMGLKAKYRWCLSGTPIHNSLDDYGALLTFVGVDPFHDKATFDVWIATPLRENARVGIPRLKDLVRATCLRRTKASPTVHLDLVEPIRNMEHINLSDEDQALYDFFRKKTTEIAVDTRAAEQAKGSTAAEGNILFHMNVLRLICNHGRALLPPRALTAWLHGSDKSEADWNMGGAVFQAGGCSLCGVDLGNPDDDDDDDPRSPSPAARHRDSLCETCYATSRDSPDSGGFAKRQQGGEMAGGLASTTQPSAKVEALLKNLSQEQNAESEGLAVNKSVIFSSWTRMLDLIEPALQRHRISFQRIDGRTGLDARREALRRFNSHDGFTVMLASIGSCSEGVDFTAANNVHIMEPHWSPMAEAQAVDRVHRKGQARRVTITRYIVPKSIETYIQWIQESKLRLISQSMNVVDEAEEVDIISERWKMLQECLGGRLD